MNETAMTLETLRPAIAEISLSAAICTFAGNSSARLTTARPGDYFDNGSVQHLSHVVLDMLQFFDMASPSAVPGAAGPSTGKSTRWSWPWPTRAGPANRSPSTSA